MTVMSHQNSNETVTMVTTVNCTIWQMSYEYNTPSKVIIGQKCP